MESLEIFQEGKEEQDSSGANVEKEKEGENLKLDWSHVNCIGEFSDYVVSYQWRAE